jgi:ribosomal-protein-alanine N-acetyltransferase
MKIIYETERLIVRQWEDGDACDLYEYCKEMETAKFLHFTPYENVEVAKDRIQTIKSKYQESGFVAPYAVVLKSENKVIGDISISSYNKAAGGCVRIGYVFNSKYWGKGYATEVVRGVFKFIKQNQIAKRIEATHDVINVKSGNVMKRAGMTFEGILRKAGENNLHSRYDVALYSILEEEIQD